jgi:capsular exopolysaccharide synthesis family protein
MADEGTAAFEPNHGVDPLDFGGYLRLLWRRKWLILGCGLIGMVVFGVGGALFLGDTYTASTRLALSPIAVESLDDPPGTVRDPERDLQTEITTIQSDEVRNDIEAAVDGDFSLTVEPGDGTDSVLLTVTAPTLAAATDARAATVEAYSTHRQDSGLGLIDEQIATAEETLQSHRADRAELVAPLEELNAQLNDAQTPDAVGAIVARQAELQEEIGPERDQLDSQIADLEDRLGQLQAARNTIASGSTASVIEESSPTRTTSATPRHLAVGLVLGVLAAVVYVLFRQVLDDSVRTKNDLERASGHRVLGLIPRVPGWRATDPARNTALEAPTSPPAEAYRTLRTSLQFLAVDRPIHRLVITSAVSGEGKTTTAANLAVTLARTGQRVIAVDADLRRPRLHEFFGATNEQGFTSAVGGARVADVLQPVEGIPSLSLLASGPIAAEPSELLGSAGTVRVMEEVDDLADVVVIDAPPILPVTDGLLVGRMSDGVIVVALGGTTKPREVNRAVELLHQVDAIVLGTVLNGVSRDLGDDYAYDYGYQYSPDEGQGPLRRLRRRKPDPALLYAPPSEPGSEDGEHGEDADSDEQPADLT